MKTTNEMIECPLCGEGKVDKEVVIKEMLGRLFGKDIKEIHDLIHKTVIERDVSHTEAIKIVSKELTKQHEEKNKIEIDRLKKEYNDLESKHRQELKEYMKKSEEKIADLKVDIKEIEKQKIELEAKIKGIPAIKGRIGEQSFEDLVAQTLPHWQLSDKMAKHGDFILRPKIEVNKNWQDIDIPILVDRKDKGSVESSDLNKLQRDAKINKMAIGMIVAKNRNQLKQKHLMKPLYLENNVFTVITCDEDFVLCAYLLRPYLEMIYTSKNRKGVDYQEILISKTKLISEKISGLLKVCSIIKKMQKDIDKIEEIVVSVHDEIESICSIQEQDTDVFDEIASHISIEA